MIRPSFSRLRPRSNARVVGGALGALVSCTVASATAQTVDLNQSTGFFIRRSPERGSGEFPLKLNRQDCLRDDANLPAIVTGDDPDPDLVYRTQIEFTPVLRGANTSMSLEIWVGTSSADCTDRNQRVGATGRCNKVFGTSNVSLNQTIVVRPRDVLRALRLGVNQGGQDLQDQGDESDCDYQTETGVGYYLMLLTNGDVKGTSAKYDRSPVDTRAPDPPTSLDVTAGDALLFPEWKLDAAATATDTLGFQFFCEAIGTGAPATGGGTGQGGDGGQVDGEGGQGGATSGSACGGSTRLVQGLLPDDLDELRCGQANGITTRTGQIGEVEGAELENGVQYAVSVATIDQVRNVGKLGPVVCGTPEEVVTFFESYRDAGGRGGGGFCGFSPTLANPLLGLVTVVGGALFVRRRRAR